MNFQLSPELDNNKVFLIQQSLLEERLDPLFYIAVQNIKNSVTKRAKFRCDDLIKSCSINRGRFGHRPRNDPRFYDGEYPFIQTGDVVAASGNNSPIQYTQTLNERGLKTSKLFQPPKLLFTIAANIGDTAILDYPSCFPDSVVAVIPKNDDVSIEYLNIYLRLIKPYVVNLAPYAAQRNLNNQQLAQVPVIIPPQEIQAEIVAKIDAAYTAKKQKEAEAQLLLDSIDDYLFGELGIELPKQEDSTIRCRMFTRQLCEVSGGRLDPFYYQNQYEIVQDVLAKRNDTKRLTNLLQFIGSGNRPKGGVSNIESGVLSFGGEHINNAGEVEVIKPKYIPSSFHDSHRDTETQLNDLLLVKDGATTGKIGIIVNAKHTLQNINEHLFLLQSIENIDPHYLLNYLISYVGKLQLKREVTGGTVTGITRSILSKVKVVVPTLSRQKEIASHISNIRNQAKELKQQAKADLAQAKKEVETMVLGEDESKA